MRSPGEQSPRTKGERPNRRSDQQKYRTSAMPMNIGRAANKSSNQTGIMTLMSLHINKDSNKIGFAQKKRLVTSEERYDTQNT